MNIHSEQDMISFGRDLAKTLTSATTKSPHATVLELVGDVGAGKTTLTRGLAEGLGIKEPITSPSFTISKSYALPKGGSLIHYDFYRLPDPGLMQDDLSEAIHDHRNIVIVEWADSVSSILPEDKITININYTDTDSRDIIIS